jgi:hypothetical protein
VLEKLDLFVHLGQTWRSMRFGGPSTPKRNSRNELIGTFDRSIYGYNALSVRFTRNGFPTLTRRGDGAGGTKR